MLELNGQKLSLAEISAVANGEDHVTLSNDARTRVEESRRVVEKIIAEGRTVYGVNTGFGRLSEVHIPAAELRELQLNLVRSTACGVGPPLSEPETRAMLLLRANVLSQGLSGARPIVLETLLALLERPQRQAPTAGQGDHRTHPVAGPQHLVVEVGPADGELLPVPSPGKSRRYTISVSS